MPSVPHARPATPRPQGWFRRLVCLLVSASLINGACLPLVHAQIAERAQDALSERFAPTADERYVALLEQIEQALHSGDGTARGSAGLLPSPDALQREAAALHAEWESL